MNLFVKKYFENLPIEKFKEKHTGFWIDQIYQIILNNGLILSVLAKKENNILDIGCGDLSLANILLKNNIIKSNYSAIDFNFKLLKQVENSLQEKINIIAADFLEYLFKNESFDLVFLINIIPYLNGRDFKKALDIVCKLMKENAILVLTDINKCQFWETEFDKIKIIYQKNLLHLLKLHQFNIIKKHSIYFAPIENISEIKMAIAKLYILRKWKF